MMAGAFLLSSCHGDLNVVQESEFTSLSMWTSSSDAQGAINGVYSKFRSSLSTSLQVYGDYRSGLYSGGRLTDKSHERMFSNVITKDLEGTDWSEFYTVINDCNLVLKYTPNIEFQSESEKNEVLANALFVRAYCYFLIARIWGNAPILTSGFESDKQDDLYPFREDASKVYAQVESDIEEALKLMPASVKGVYKANVNTINMLKADYFLWKAKVLGGGNDALKTAQASIDKVINSGNYQILDNFADVFDVNNEGNKEIIFAFNYQINEYTGGYPSYYLAGVGDLENPELTNNPIPVGSHAQYICITTDYADFIRSDANDTRAEVSYGECQDSEKFWRWINKYKGEWINETRYFSSDMIMYRYAETLLMKAEVENALGNTSGAIDALKRLEKRSYGTQNRYTGMSKAQLDNEIVDEYLKEFVAEGKSWWIFVRFGVVFDRVEVLKDRKNVTNILLWPVSSSCLNTNPNIKQTEGYN